ncbi:hypothetical protein [Oleiharenicola lentus]|uniref:hypothetical protein n=1 Tax=Oleiharenicola lentus TaxID=2508720 RepID=UPI003F668C29
MRLSKEIIVLVVLLVGTMAFVLWYVADRKAKNRAEAGAPVVASPVSNAPIPATSTLAPVPASPAPVALGGDNEKKTIDFSSGQPIVKDSAEDKAAMDAALKDMAAAHEDVTFGPSTKTKPTPVTPPKS